MEQNKEWFNPEEEEPSFSEAFIVSAKIVGVILLVWLAIWLSKC